MTTDELEDLVQEIYELGCPVYTGHDGSRTRDGCSFCFWCDAMQDYVKEEHADGCPWLKIEEFANGVV